MAIGKVSVFFFLLSLILTVNVYHAQLGEVAGAFVMNMSIGSSEMRNWTLSNTGDAPLNFRVVLPQFAPVPNATAPIVTAVPMNGTIAAHTSVTIKITIALPYLNNKAGIRWDGVLGSIATPLNYTQGFGGAQVQAGVGKEIVVRSEPPVLPLYELVGAIVAAVIVAGSALYYYNFKFLPKYNSKEAKASRAKRKKEAEREKLEKMKAKLQSQQAKLLAQTRALGGGKVASARSQSSKPKATSKSAKGTKTSSKAASSKATSKKRAKKK